METTRKNKAETTWEKSKISLTNYVNYIGNKDKQGKKFELTLIDLLYISNFKGGNATINVDEALLRNILESYSTILRHIDNEFGDNSLAEISDEKFEKLKEYIDAILMLCQNKETSIDGFKASFLSALLHSYFPNLIPILDRRVLINMQLVDKSHIQKSSGQINKIENFYWELLKNTREISKSENLSVRDIDRKYFIIELPEWARIKVIQA